MGKIVKKSNQKTLTVFAIFAVFILCASGLFAYFEYFHEEEKELIEEKIEEKSIDERISPLENQGLILEVLRIRHRGLHDKLLKFGSSWRQKPSFYFVRNVDDLEWSSKKTSTYTAWDTMLKEQKVMRDVEEEQETSTITLTIFEIEKIGLLKLRKQDVEKDSFTVNYDYRTGRWYGEDDHFRDKDGYGHYVGDTFEVWFNIYQTDYDSDGIPYWTEVNILDTDPWTSDTFSDPDEDGIPTAWEWKYDYDPHTWDDHIHLDPDIDGIENIEEYQIAKWLSNPYAQDVYVEADGMETNRLFVKHHYLFKESQQHLIEKFCRHGINLYFDDGWPDGPKKWWW